MRIIDRKWTDLAAGYRAVLSLQSKLETEFGRAVQVGQQQQFRKDVAEWQKKRRVFFALVVVAPLSILVLCLASYYFREVACVIIYWVVLVLVILVTLAIAGRSYIKDVINRPELRTAARLPVDLQGAWWASLSPQEMMLPPGKGGDKMDFLVLLAGALPDTTLARRGQPVDAEACVYLFAPSGAWLFMVRGWKGNIVRQEGLWKQVRKRSEAVVLDHSPDDQWLRQKELLVKILTEHFPQSPGLIQGGVAFIHPKVHLDKTLIQGNTAAYGPAKAWVERLVRAASVDGFSLEMQLETLDALIAAEGPAGGTGSTLASAQEEAERLYRQSAGELRLSVAKMMK